GGAGKGRRAGARTSPWRAVTVRLPLPVMEPYPNPVSSGLCTDPLPVKLAKPLKGVFALRASRPSARGVYQTCPYCQIARDFVCKCDVRDNLIYHPVPWGEMPPLGRVGQIATLVRSVSDGGCVRCRRGGCGIRKDILCLILGKRVPCSHYSSEDDT